MRLCAGLDRHAAQLYFIQEVYQLETYGMAYVDASMNGGPVIVGVGAHNIRVFTPAWMCIKKYNIQINLSILT